MEAATGARLLGEVEEANLEEIYYSLRSTLDPVTTIATRINKQKLTHLQALDDLAARQFRATQAPTIGISGRHLPLLYTLIATLVSPPHCFAVLVLDLDGRFDATRLASTSENLHHVYVHSPTRNSPDYLRALIAEADGFMLYSDAAHGSAGRPWWGTVVVGGLGAGDVVTGWKGWLRVDREQVRSFPPGISAEEALEQRKQRQDAVDAAGWAANSQWGGFVFHEMEAEMDDQGRD